MEIPYELTDNENLVHDICNYDTTTSDIIPVKVSLPEYLDVTTLLALYKRMVEVSKITGKKLRLIACTKNIDVEKYATRLFADRDDIFLTIDWR